MKVKKKLRKDSGLNETEETWWLQGTRDLGLAPLAIKDITGAAGKIKKLPIFVQKLLFTIKTNTKIGTNTIKLVQWGKNFN